MDTTNQTCESNNTSTRFNCLSKQHMTFFFLCDCKSMFLMIILSIVAFVALTVATITSQARLIKQCLGISITIGIYLLIIPGLNFIGLILLMICGLMIMAGKCKSCHDKIGTNTKKLSEVKNKIPIKS